MELFYERVGIDKLGIVRACEDNRIVQLNNIRTISYEVFVDGILHGSTKRTFMGISGLKCGNEYTITVKASDTGGNQSGATALSVKTSACTSEKTVK